MLLGPVKECIVRRGLTDEDCVLGSSFSSCAKEREMLCRRVARILDVRKADDASWRYAAAVIERGGG